MIIEIKIPSPGESVTEVEIGRWLVGDGSLVRKGEELAEIESDKATLTIIAEASGRISVKVKEGVSVAVGSVACTIDSGEAPTEETRTEDGIEQEAEVKMSDVGQRSDSGRGKPVLQEAAVKISPVAREMMKEHNLSAEGVMKEIRRIGKKEIEAVIGQGRQSTGTEPELNKPFPRESDRERMTVLRRKLSERLVAVKNETAMLTTFNEVDMSGVMEIRKMYQQKFSEKHGTKLGFMSFFTKAVAIAAKCNPSVNSMIDGEEMIIPRYVDVGIAVQTPKGLMVPVVRNAESKSVADIEREIKDLAEKARNKKITMEELSGGTITITNGGVFGSLLSTPIINPPQSAILGMHNIVDRPVAVSGKVKIRPMMYIALSYDHRIIDGKDSVGFLVKVKEMIENPVKMVLSGVDPLDILLEL